MIFSIFKVHWFVLLAIKCIVAITTPGGGLPPDKIMIPHVLRKISSRKVSKSNDCAQKMSKKWAKHFANYANFSNIARNVLVAVSNSCAHCLQVEIAFKSCSLSMTWFSGSRFKVSKSTSKPLAILSNVSSRGCRVTPSSISVYVFRVIEHLLAASAKESPRLSRSRIRLCARVSMILDDKGVLHKILQRTNRCRKSPIFSRGL